MLLMLLCCLVGRITGTNQYDVAIYSPDNKTYALMRVDDVLAECQKTESASRVCNNCQQDIAVSVSGVFFNCTMIFYFVLLIISVIYLKYSA